MDPRVLAEKKGLVIARIEAGLVFLASAGFASLAADELRAAVVARNEPHLNDLKRFEAIADLVDALVVQVGHVVQVPDEGERVPRGAASVSPARQSGREGLAPVASEV